MLGYYWPTMIADSIQFAKKGRECQIHGDYIHQPRTYQHPTTVSWLFEAWGMDIIGKIHPPSDEGHHFILATTDYFSKWSEAVPLAEVKSANVVNFVKSHIICRFDF